jgi:hypothetical protein
MRSREAVTVPVTSTRSRPGTTARAGEYPVTTADAVRTFTPGLAVTA